MCLLEVYTCIFKFSIILNIRIATELLIHTSACMYILLYLRNLSNENWHHM